MNWRKETEKALTTAEKEEGQNESSQLTRFLEDGEGEDKMLTATKE